MRGENQTHREPPNNSMDQSRSHRSAGQNIPRLLRKGLLSSSKEPATSLSPKPDESSPHLPTLFIKNQL